MATRAPPPRRPRPITAPMARWAAGLALRADLPGRRPRGQAVPARLARLRARRLPAARRADRPRGARRDRAASGPATVIGTGEEDGPGHRVAPERADGPGDGLQRHLLEAGPVAPVRHHPGGHGLRRADEAGRAGADRRHRPRPRVRAAALRGGLPRDPRARLAPRDADRVRLAHRGRAHARPRRGEDPARHRHLRAAATSRSARRWPASSP